MPPARPPHFDQTHRGQQQQREVTNKWHFTIHDLSFCFKSYDGWPLCSYFLASLSMGRLVVIHNFQFDRKSTVTTLKSLMIAQCNQLKNILNLLKNFPTVKNHWLCYFSKLGFWAKTFNWLRNFSNQLKISVFFHAILAKSHSQPVKTYF